MQAFCLRQRIASQRHPQSRCAHANRANPSLARSHATQASPLLFSRPPLQQSKLVVTALEAGISRVSCSPRRSLYLGHYHRVLKAFELKRTKHIQSVVFQSTARQYSNQARIDAQARPFAPDRSLPQNKPPDEPPLVAADEGPDLRSSLPLAKPMPLYKKYLSLAKWRLASFVVLTAVGGYLVAPGPIDLADFVICTVGTSLAIASANTINQYLEVEHDLVMKRTRTRMLPSGALSLNHALAFGVITGAVGSIMLAVSINMLAASLAFSNILLYTLVYTPMKRVHPINTWVGSIVGAIPPLIGWASKTGGLEPGAWVLFAVLFLWQLPHFFALSWPLRFDYRNAGYKMLCVTNPDRVALETLLTSAAMLGLGPAAYYSGLTTWPFMIDATILHLYLVWMSYGFYKDNSNTAARKAFKATLYYLPLFIALMLVHLQFDVATELVSAVVEELPSHAAATTDVSSVASDAVVVKAKQ